MAGYTEAEAEDALLSLSSAVGNVQQALNVVCDARDGETEDLLSDVMNDLSEAQNQISALKGVS